MYVAGDMWLWFGHNILLTYFSSGYTGCPGLQTLCLLPPFLCAEPIIDLAYLEKPKLSSSESILQVLEASSPELSGMSPRSQL